MTAQDLRATATGDGPAGSGPVGIGIIGAGTISAQYLQQLTSFPDVDVLAIGDLVPEAAASRAEEFGVPHFGTVEELLAREDIEIVVNLTIPAAHFDVSRQILAAGKHVWTEKPLTTDRESAAELLRIADEAGLRIGSAPDTVLGAGIQTGLRAVRDGEIGTPKSGLTIFQVPGPEAWHPNPAFLFQTGAGPLYDLGPYYLTTLVLAFGPVASVSAVASTARTTRTIGSGPRAGEDFDVTVPTQVSALLSFDSGANATVLLSFDSAHVHQGVAELYGTEGTVALPDPNVFDGPTRHITYRGEEWTEKPAEGSVAGRGLGTLDLARSIRTGAPHRLQGDLAAHVLDIMVSIDEAAEDGEIVQVASTCAIPDPLPADFDPTARTL
ncbi:Gfo/Idh/MocA family protein [Brachybacterium sp. AOP25-B2-12]|uniref:Gfo/Idh/MocA family protein n=1 Tax=Brachybacterium sp. AOP25-B2-12 TaxID=3457710 RepID=UPI004034D0E9